jgi:hypothetical protein
MNVLDSIYDSLLPLLKNISESQNYLDYAQRKGDEVDSLVVFSERISSYVNELESSKEESLLPDKLDKILEVLEDFRSTFPDFPNSRFIELLFILKLIMKLKEAVEDEEDYDLRQDVNVETFSIVKLSEKISFKNFLHVDRANMEDSFLLLDFEDEGALLEFISSHSMPANLLVQLLGKFGSAENSFSPFQYVFIKSTFSEKEAAVRAFTSLHLIKEGKYTHKPSHYSYSPNVNSNRKVKIEKHYQQFNEALIILSEYNYQKDILDKYIRLYHVVENFMYRGPLVALERKQNSSFSIRDFQRMYSQVVKTELDVLNKFIKAVFDELYDETQKFSSYVFDKWRLIFESFQDETLLDALLINLNITNKSQNIIKANEIQENSLVHTYSQFIYSFRNSLVHNKDTEFHLTHNILLNHDVIGDTANVFLEKFLIPTLEEIIFYLIIEKNELISFRSSSIKLWRDS